MRRTLGLLCVATLTCLPLSALAQEDAGEDGGMEDAGAIEDAGAAEDAVATPDAATVEDAATLEDAATAEDAAIPEDAGMTEDATAAEDGGASAPDAGLFEDAGPGCGEVDFIGECDGDLVRYCLRGNELSEIDCGTEYGSWATCGLLDCTDYDEGCLGYYCVARLGEACEGDDTLPCDVAAQQGCLQGVCASSSSCDPGTFTTTCSGTWLTYCEHTERDRDCSEGGAAPYTCEEVAGTGRCLGQEGGRCNPADAHACATGFSCVGGVCTAGTTADAGPGNDAGSADDDDDDDDDDGGCGCSAVGAPAPLLLLACAGVALLTARRRR